ncbi:hypothetical protein M6B38_270940 [Iris pallida]|uniref:Uncharacterized protein n=1 Tax=Iris pallida TaxID=29817 RepID=A0AAX6I7D4_IRIPA|nr:hypothetical protein M6B38_270940 [Iris pallida]
MRRPCPIVSLPPNSILVAQVDLETISLFSIFLSKASKLEDLVQTSMCQSLGS